MSESDMESVIATFRAHPDLRNFYMQFYGGQSETEFLEWFDIWFHTVLRRSIVLRGVKSMYETWGIRYTHIPSAHDGCPPLTIRWWLDRIDIRNGGYNFDIIDPQTSPAKSLSPENLNVLRWESGTWRELIDLEQATRLSDPLNATQPGPPILGWCTEPGSRIRFQIQSGDGDPVVLGEALAPHIRCEEHTQYSSFATLEDALKDVA